MNSDRIDLDDYDFALPGDRIAQHPLPERDASKLLCLDRETGATRDAEIRTLPGLLREGDLLVVNATRVLPARVVGERESGGAAEMLLLGPAPTGETAGSDRYRALLKISGRLRPGIKFRFSAEDGANPFDAEIVELGEKGEVTLAVPAGTDPYLAGRPPLPPYIAHARDGFASNSSDDRERYQTIFARVPGAVAAPTAGLHLTDALLQQLETHGIERAEVVLHVGAGTFRPIGADELKRGRLHAEIFELPEATADAIARTRARGGRVVAVGTTATRVLESQATRDGLVQPGSGETDLFLRPGDTFRVVDALLTNFHLPRSSLLLLVAAFAGREAVLAAYQHAIQFDYRFYSYGDAMLIS